MSPASYRAVLRAPGAAAFFLATAAGGWCLAAQRRTAPPTSGAGGRHRTGRWLLRPGFAVLAGVNLALGGFFGAMQISVTAFAAGHSASAVGSAGAAAAAGWAVGTFGAHGGFAAAAMATGVMTALAVAGLRVPQDAAATQQAE